MTIDKKRLAEIRGMEPWDLCGAGVNDAVRDLLAMLDEERDRSRRLMDERDGARGALAIRYALRRDIEEILDVESGPASDEQLSRGVEAAKALRQRAEDAERKLAALHVAASRYVHSLGEDEETHPTLGRVFVSRDDDGAEDALDEALRDAGPVAERHDREVRAKELRRLSAAAVAPGGPRGWSTPTALSAWIEREANRIERGEV